MLIFTLIMTTLLSLLMIGFGFIFIKNTPKNANYLFGYRTSMSMKNKDTWEFAHKYSGKVWIVSGFITVILSYICAFTFQKIANYNQFMIALIYIQVIVLLLVIPLTEIALRKTFDKNGIRKQK